MSCARAALFHVGDAVFLAVVGAQSALVMHVVEQWEWNAVAAALVGMLGAMVIQTLMALAVAPVLGSIEAMTPSMVVAMVGPMTLDALRMIGLATDARAALGLGIALGVLMFCFVELYGVAVWRSLGRTFPKRAP